MKSYRYIIHKTPLLLTYDVSQEKQCYDSWSDWLSEKSHLDNYL